MNSNKQDKLLRAQLEKEREQQILEDIERTEKDRIQKKGKQVPITLRDEGTQAERLVRQLPIPAHNPLPVRPAYRGPI